MIVAIVTLSCTSFAEKGKVYVVLFMHNEDQTFGDIEDPGVRASYLRHRQKLKEMSEYLNANGVSFAWQSEWKFLELALMYENADLMAETNGKNIVRWMHEDMGIAVDAHSHENHGYNYADVACLLDSLGVEPTRIIGGHIWDPYISSYADWERFRQPLQGSAFPHFLWEADVLMGSGTPNHTYDPAPSGIWRPADKYHFWEDDPEGGVLCVGQYTGDLAGVEELVRLRQSGTLEESDILTCCIHTPQGFPPDFMEDFSQNLIEPLLAMRDAGDIELVDFSELITIWEGEFSGRSHLYNPLTDYVPDQFDLWVPGETAGERGLFVRVTVPETPRYEAGLAPVVVHVAGGWEGSGISPKSHGLHEQGFIELDFNFPGSGVPAARSGGEYDHRGQNCIQAVKDVVRFAMGLSQDQAGYHLSDMLGDVIPDVTNTGLCGWSNGGNATITAAGACGDELPGLAWIVNWESPVGDGMPNVDAGGNARTNPAYNPETGEFSAGYLRYSQTLVTRDGDMGALFFDINDNGIANPDVDFIPSYQYYQNKCFYSLWLRLAAEDLGVAFPDHIPGIDETQAFWQYRNGANWMEEALLHNPDMMFMVEAGDVDHVQGAPDHPHILIQYTGFLNAGARFVRLNPDRFYVEQLLDASLPDAADNDGMLEFDHMSVRQALQPRHIPILTGQKSTVAAVCEIADRSRTDNTDPQIDASRISSISAPSGGSELTVYPNPFSAELTITLDLKQEADVSVQILDMHGRLLFETSERALSSGKQNIRLSSSHLSSQLRSDGLYLLRIQAGNRSYQKVLILHR